MEEPRLAEAELRAFDAGVSLGDYLRVVIRRKWAVVIIFLTTVVLATLVSLRMPKVYQTSVTVKVSQRVVGQTILPTFYYDPFFLETEIEMIRSRALLTTVANRLGMTYRVAAAPPRLRDAVARAEFVEGTPAGDLVVTFTGPGTFKVDFDGRPAGTGRPGEFFEAEFGTLLLETDRARAGDKIIIKTQKVDAVVSGLIASVHVKPVENVNMLRVVVKGRDPKKVSRLANVVADVYVEASLEEKKLQATTTRIFIEEQIERTANNLREAEIALETFKRETGILDMSAETRQYVTLLGNLESQLLEESLDRRISAVELDILKRRRAALSGEGEAFPTEEVLISRFAAGSALQQLENRIIELQRRRAELVQTRTPEHPLVGAVDAEIAAAEGELRRGLSDALEHGELATNVELGEEKVAMIEEAIADYRDLTASLPRKEMELNRLVRAYQVNEQVYTTLLEKLQEAKINEAMRTADIRVVDYALVPRVPVSPNYAKNILVGILLGVFLGVGVAYMLEFADTSLNTVEEVERRLGTPVIGIIPRIGGGGVSRLVQRAGEFDYYFATHTYPKSPVAEAFRTLRTAIRASGVDVEVKKVLITGTGLGDGKTITSVNLAIIFAQAGDAVVLVDCDLRRATVHRAFGVERVPGLAEVIMDRAELDEALQPTGVENLTILPSGVVPPNPSELLGSKRFETVLGELAAKFGRVVMDAPPVLAVTDALVLGGLADGVCFVVCAGRTDRNAARRALEMLERSGCRVLGVVFNQVEMSRVFGAYGYKYYSQYYQAYTEQDGPS
ncbi:MAG TPA: polysaccharide biosynthesis tyrosine autokinase [bacterium]|nr:polysaccharide biosynthesis tyrosine autokinase [bacterium]